MGTCRCCTCSELAGYGVGLENQTPLWYYVLAEAELIGDGITLGPVGGRIVGEVFIGLLQLDPRSYLRAPSRAGGRRCPAGYPASSRWLTCCGSPGWIPASRGQYDRRSERALQFR